MRLLAYFACLGFAAAGTFREADLGEPLTKDDFDFAESEEYKNEVAIEESHDENMSASLFEGDIQLTEKERDVLEERGISGLRQVIGKYKWPKSADGLVRIPLKVPSGLSQKRRADIARAVDEYKQKTCIRFVGYEGEMTGYISLDTKAGQCSSSLGMNPRGYNSIKFGPHCSWGNLCHEFMHSLGFYHEHTRIDRDRFVSVIWGNIPDDWLHNFYKCNEGGRECEQLSSPYDYGSIMHYGEDLNGKLVLVPKREGVSIGQRSAISEIDVQDIQEYYECTN